MSHWSMASAKGVWGFALKMLRKPCSLGGFEVTKKVSSWGGCAPPPCILKGLKVLSYIWGKQYI